MAVSSTAVAFHFGRGLTLSSVHCFLATSTFLNYTRIIEETAHANDTSMTYHMPRVEFVAALQGAASCSGWSASNPNDVSWAYQPESPTTSECYMEIGQCANYHCSQTPMRGRVVVIDSER